MNDYLAHAGEIVFRHACKMGLESIVSKRLGSRYRSGRWPNSLKFKNPEAPAVKREAEEEWGRWRKMRRDLFAKVDRQVSALKERIARQREVIKQAKLRGHSTAAAEQFSVPCTKAFARSSNAASKSLRGWKPNKSRR